MMLPDNLQEEYNRLAQEFFDLIGDDEECTDEMGSQYILEHGSPALVEAITNFQKEKEEALKKGIIID